MLSTKEGDCYEAIYYNVSYDPIPSQMVDEDTDEKGRSTYTFYDCVKCNRDELGLNDRLYGDEGDLNGDVGKQWLTLYTTKNAAAGEPILADMLTQKGSTPPPVGKTALSMFGYEDAVNIVNEEYSYKDSLGGLYLFYTSAPDGENAKDTAAPAADSLEVSESTYDISAAGSKQNTSSASDDITATANTGSVLGTGSLVMTSVLSAAAGALICFLITRKRKIQ